MSLDVKSLEDPISSSVKSLLWKVTLIVKAVSQLSHCDRNKRLWYKFSLGKRSYLRNNCRIGFVNCKSSRFIMHDTFGIISNSISQAISALLKVVFHSRLDVFPFDFDIIISVGSCVCMFKAKRMHEFMLDDTKVKIVKKCFIRNVKTVISVNSWSIPATHTSRGQSQTLISFTPIFSSYARWTTISIFDKNILFIRRCCCPTEKYF